MKRNENRPFVIGLTGGVGSGKSRLAAFAVRNYQIRLIIADDVGRELMEPGKRLYDALLSEFGRKILAKDGSLDKKKLSEICFKEPGGQAKLNQIEHPVIREEILKKIARTRLPFVLLEAALLEEGELTGDCDEILYVHTDREVRIARLMSSRGYSREKCEKIIALQYSEKEFRCIATAETDNSGEFKTAKDALAAQFDRWGVPKR